MSRYFIPMHPIQAQLPLALLLVISCTPIARAQPSPTYQLLMQDIIINADLWSDAPEILSAGYGFEGIMGVPGDRQAVIDAGGAWQDLPGYENPPYSTQTSSATPQSISLIYGYPVYYADAMPIVFSWPVLPSSVSPDSFRIILNTGEIVTPAVASIFPNYQYNERNTVVIFGEFGNRIPPGNEGSIHPVRVEIAETAKPLQLVGPDGTVSAVGLSKESTNPYLPNGGPTLVGAKLSVMSTEGSGAPAFLSGNLPNHGVALYGEDAQFRLRILTTGGFSPNGVSSLTPDAFENHFRIRVVDFDEQGNEIEMWLTTTGIAYETSRGFITILGLAELGLRMDEYDLVYVSDSDNQIDIILKGDEEAMRLITHVEIPAEGDYLPFYNPGGPGMTPTPGVTYTQPGPYTLQEVMIALDDPFTVTYIVPETRFTALTLSILTFLLSRRKRNSDGK